MRQAILRKRRRRRLLFIGGAVVVATSLLLCLASFVLHRSDAGGSRDPTRTGDDHDWFARLDALDVLPPRPEERFIPFQQFVDCLDHRLNVDHRKRREYSFGNVEATIPYLVLPVTVEQGDMKALMCNLSVSIQHLVYVQNGGVGSMTAFLGGLQEVFSFTKRLKLLRLPHNYGYSVALNAAMRDALAMPFEEVPFFMMANNDVRIPARMLEDRLPHMYTQSLAGQARVAELEAEVATEPNAYTPERFRAAPLRSTDGFHALVTSRLLPDRIRYQPREQRRTAFTGFYGGLYPDHNNQTAFWGLTRLAMEVTGFFDENCYPAYFEDLDYVRRMTFLGFQPSFGEQRVPGLLHLGNGATLAVARQLHAQTSTGDVLPFIRAAAAIIKEYYFLRYAAYKYTAALNEALVVFHEPYPNEPLPLDVYVLNVRRQRALSEMVRGAVTFFTAHPEGRRLHVRFEPLSYVAPERRDAVDEALSAPFVASDSYLDDRGSLRTVSSIQ